jgi:lipid-A-disaccharide synthase
MAAAGREAPTIMLVVGEPSGDVTGAELMRALKALQPAIRIVGVGGPAMSAEGLQSLFPLDATSVMGLREVVPRIPAILRRVKQAADFAVATRPDLVVLIDSPDFTHRVARRIKRRDPSLRTANYAPPQVWGSRPGRARRMARYMDAVLTLLPFEAPYFSRHGIATRFVGYPVIERAGLMTGGDAFRRKHGLGGETPLLAVLPGSRRNEIRFILPPFREAVRLLAAEIPGLVCVMPTIGHVAPLVREVARDWPTPVHVVESEAEKFSAFDAADVALAASGTVTTELALARTPMVVGYRMGALTYQIAKRFVRVRYITLVNLILGREAVPEFIQGRCEPVALAAAVEQLFTSEDALFAQINAMDEATRALGAGGESPSLRAAKAALELAQEAP